jgi:hypothetical protein
LVQKASQAHCGAELERLRSLEPRDIHGSAEILTRLVGTPEAGEELAAHPV